jgi:uncharacterized protein involved in exopolysaccharide biosynthesis
MNYTQQDASTIADQDADISLLDWFIVLAKRKKIILFVTLSATIIAAGVSLILPPTYRASTTILPPQQSQSTAAALVSQLGGAAGLGSLGGLKTPNDLYVGMLKSRSVADAIINKFDLVKRYEADYRDEAIATLDENTEIKSGKDGLITIAVNDRDRARVAEIANSYVDELSKLTNSVAVTEAAQRRLFYERQLKKAKDNLASSEIALKRGLDTSGVVSVDGDTRAIVETIGRVRAQVTAKEIQLNSMQAFLTPNHQDFKRAQEELASLKQQLNRLENGEPNAKPHMANDQDGLESIRLLRDVKYYQMLYDLLAKQYEIARLDEAKDSTLIQVLDKAVEPERRAKPKRGLIVMGAFVSAFFLSSIFVLLLEYIKTARGNEETERKYRNLRAQFKMKKK